MKHIKSIETIRLIFLPLLLVLLGQLVTSWRGPGYLVNNSDPDYLYLFNSLNVATGVPPRHMDHPGSTIQALGAATLRAMHPASSSAELIESIIDEPEKHIRMIRVVLAVAHALMIFLSGYFVFLATGSSWLGIAYQALPLTSAGSWLAGSALAPDFIALGAAMLVTAIAFVAASGLARLGHFALMGAAIGTLLLSKITGLPSLLAAALVLRKRPLQRALVAVVVAGSIYLVALLALYGKTIKTFLYYSFSWVLTLATHTGSYGTGNKGLPDPSAWLSGAFGLLTEAPFHALGMGCGMAATIILLRARRAELALFSAANLAIAFLQLVIASKNPAFRYLMPGFASAAMSVVLLAHSLKLKAGHVRALAAACAALACLPAARMAIDRDLPERRQRELEQVEKTLAATQCRLVAPARTSSTIQYALQIGNNFADLRYSKQLSEKYPDYLVYNFYDRSFFGFDNQPIASSQIRKKWTTMCLRAPDLSPAASNLPQGAKLKVLIETRLGDSVGLLNLR